MNHQPDAATARPGRKRSAESHLAILAAAFDLIGEVGYAGLTVEGIAARSGAGKQTIYRWWPSKADVLLEALATKANLSIPNTDGGSYPADLRAFLTATFTLARDEKVIGALRALMAEAQINADFGDRFRTTFLRQRREALRAILDRARARGDLPAQPPADFAIDMVFGILWYRLLATHAPLDDALTEELLTALAAPA